MATVSVQNVWKQYGAHVVLENLRLEVADNEFVTIVARRAAARPRSFACCWAPSSPVAGRY